MKKLLALVMLLVVVGCGSDNKLPVLGKWKLDTFRDAAGDDINGTIEIKDTEIGLALTCSLFGGGAANGKLSVSLTDKEITVKTAATVGAGLCSFDFDAGKAPYKINGNKLTIQSPTTDGMTFTRQ